MMNLFWDRLDGEELSNLGSSLDQSIGSKICEGKRIGEEERGKEPEKELGVVEREREGIGSKNWNVIILVTSIQLQPPIYTSWT